MPKILTSYINYTIAHYITEPVRIIKNKYKKILREYDFNCSSIDYLNIYSSDIGTICPDKGYVDEWLENIFRNPKQTKLLKSASKDIILPSILENPSRGAFKIIKKIYQSPETYIKDLIFSRYNEDNIRKNLFKNSSDRIIKYFIRKKLINNEDIIYALERYGNIYHKWTYNLAKKRGIDISHISSLSIEGLPKKNITKKDIHSVKCNPDYIDEIINLIDKYNSYVIEENPAIYEINMKIMKKLYKYFDKITHKLF